MSKIGLDYFSFDVDFFQDEKIQFLSARFGMKGEAVAVRLLCKIYRQGYYTDWNNDIALLFAKSVGDGCQHSFVNDVVSELIKRGFFDRDIFDRFSILTSRGIQKRYFEATGRRTKTDIREELLLVNKDDFPNVYIIKQNVNISNEYVNNSNENVDISEQSKVKKSKVKKSIGDSGESQKPIGLLSREPKNDMEKVNKKWLENYIAIHGSQPVNPTWNITAPLVSKAINQVGVEKVLHALDTARQDDFCIKSGYLLKIIMSTNVISRLVNKPPSAAPPPGLSGKKSLSGLVSTF